MMQFLKRYVQMVQWRKRDYGAQSPQCVKETVLQRYAIDGATWVETGTHMGITTRFLSEFSDKVYTLEPAPKLYARAKRLFAGSHVEVINGASESVFPELLPKLSGDVCFWLDGHYSAGMTFQGDTDCPIEAELNAIDASFDLFDRISILIDDVRAFVSDADWAKDYPSQDFLVDWARAHGLRWRVEHDIFIMGHSV